MRKLLISIAISVFSLSGCSYIDTDIDTSKLFDQTIDKIPLIYRPEVQQGNVITQENIDKLNPGMSKRQVRHVMGSPVLIDVFHKERWDYIYTIGEGSYIDEKQHVSLFFEKNVLTNIEGDFRPLPPEEQSKKEKEIVVSVPDWESPNKSLFQKALEKFNVHKKEEPN